MVWWFIILLAVCLAVLGFYQLRCAWLYANRMSGVLQMEVWLNGRAVEAREIAQENKKFYPRVDVGRYYIPLPKSYRSVPQNAGMAKIQDVFGKKKQAADVLLGPLLAVYAGCYACSGFGQDAIYRYLTDCATDLGDKARLQGTERGKRFRLCGICTVMSTERPFVLSGQSDGLEKCAVCFPVPDGSSNERFSEAWEFGVCGLEIGLHYFSDKTDHKRRG